MNKLINNRLTISNIYNNHLRQKLLVKQYLARDNASESIFLFERATYSNASGRNMG